MPVGEAVELRDPPVDVDLLGTAQVDDGPDAQSSEALAVGLGQSGQVVGAEEPVPGDAAAVALSGNHPRSRKLKTFVKGTPRSPMYPTLSAAAVGAAYPGELRHNPVDDLVGL